MKLTQARNFYDCDTPYPPLHINSCGYFSELDCDTHCDRPNGRNDYQIIYMLEGEMEYQTSGKTEVAPKGTLLLFKPHEPQIYGCNAEKRSSYIWVHFDGEQAETILRECGLYDKNCYFAPSYHSGERIVGQMMDEIRRRPTSYQIRLQGLFSTLVSGLSRALSDNAQSAAIERLRPALDQIESFPELDMRVSDYAALCHMSEFHFLHEFKTLTGTSPISYRDTILIRHACTLLENTSLLVGEIAANLGIHDALYFSKKFKKHVGLSPSQYRESNGK
ncbi:MAG: AraC family transcriptional regulator [Ruminococcaceae bacterium]|nr:AraC family transcriptional regulator [Oscillospiraceae bacterium]